MPSIGQQLLLQAWHPPITTRQSVSYDFHGLQHLQNKGYMRRVDDVRNKPSLSWAIFCLSFCSEARSVMLIWKDRIWKDSPNDSNANLTISGQTCRKSHITCERNTLPLQGFPLFSAAYFVHGCFLLFPGPSDKWHHNFVTYRWGNEAIRCYVNPWWLMKNSQR